MQVDADEKADDDLFLDSTFKKSNNTADNALDTDRRVSRQIKKTPTKTMQQQYWKIRRN